MALFKIKKKEDKPAEAPIPSASPGLPVDQVTNMRTQGYTDNQIIQALQRDGYTSQQIFDSMKQSDLSSAVGAPLPQEEAPMPMEAPPPMPGGEMPMEAPPPPMADTIQPPYGAPPEIPGKIDSERIEQIAEAIIDEKWEEIAKNINKMVEWKDSVEARFTNMNSDFKKMKEDFDRLHSSILGKIGEYDQNILNVGTEIKAMEKVFQKILPSLTDNVTQLSKITKDMKSKK